MAALLELATQNLIGRHISTQQYSHRQARQQLRLQPDEKPVSTGVHLQPLLAGTSNLRLVKSHPQAVTGVLKTQCNLPYPYRFPKSKSQSGQPSRTDSINSLTDMVTTYQRVKEPTRAR
jgi:hypothetical protein